MNKVGEKIKAILRKNFFHYDRLSIHTVLSCFVVILFLTFVSGYYWGKKNYIEELQEIYTQEAITDTLSYGLALQAHQECD